MIFLIHSLTCGTNESHMAGNWKDLRWKPDLRVEAATAPSASAEPAAAVIAAAATEACRTEEDEPCFPELQYDYVCV